LFRSVGDENMAAHPIGALGCLAFDRGEHGRGRELVEESVSPFPRSSVYRDGRTYSGSRPLAECDQLNATHRDYPRGVQPGIELDLTPMLAVWISACATPSSMARVTRPTPS
jgi:hypothetical protein